MPGYEVDSLTTRAGDFAFFAISSAAAWTQDKSGLRASSSGVGTAITMTSQPSMTDASVLALYAPVPIREESAVSEIPSICDVPLFSAATKASLTSKPATLWPAPAAPTAIVRPT